MSKKFQKYLEKSWPKGPHCLQQKAAVLQSNQKKSTRRAAIFLVDNFNYICFLTECLMAFDLDIKCERIFVGKLLPLFQEPFKIKKTALGQSCLKSLPDRSQLSTKWQTAIKS